MKGEHQDENETSTRPRTERAMRASEISYWHALTVRAFCRFLTAWRRCFLFRARNPGGWARGSGWLAAWLMLVTPVAALDSERRADSYSIQGWSTEQGLPSSKIRGITETRDGYLWIATAQGMARFDGMHFTVFTRATNPELGGGGFFSVVEAPDGTLWFGGDNGLFCWRAGHFERFTTREGLADDYVRMLFLSWNGSIVICTRNGFSFIHDGHITTPGGVWKQVSNGARSYLKRADGSILLGNVDKMWRVSGEEIEPFSGTAGLPGDGFTSLIETPDGSIWIGYSRGLRRVYPDGKTEDYGAAEGLMDSQVSALRADRDGNLWIGTTGGGLYRLAHGRIEAATYPEQFGTTPIRQIYEDREGGLWIATATGLFRLKDNISASIGVAQGLKQTSISAVLETSDGSWWIGLMNGGVYRYDGTQAKPLATPATITLDAVTSLAEEPAGTLWIGTLSGLYRHAGGVTTSLFQREQATAWLKQLAHQPDALLPGLAHRRVNSIIPDGAGGLWVATDGALYHGGEAGFRAYTQSNGLPGSTFKSVIRSRHGDIWAVVPPEGVACFHEGRWTNYLCGKAISDIFPRKAYEDTAGTIWVTTEGGGLNRFKDGHWRIFTTREGLEDDYISGITEDNVGNLWIGCPSGIMRIPLKQFDELDAGRRAVLQPRIVNRSDGLPSAEVNLTGSPNESRISDGRLLFATDRGVAVIQPGDLKISGTLPPMHIERFVVNGADVNLSGPLVIPPGKNDVQIRYTAISLLAAEKVRFKIRLLPLDRDWVETGDRRDVRYAKLPPGHYTFRVTACNSDGIWNEEGIALAFTVQPFFYQTAWFIGLVLATVIGTGLGVYHVRVRQTRRRTAELERLVMERTRQLQSAKEAAEAAVSARNEFITALKQAEAERENLNRQLLETSRRAGMAEIATNVLHNVGNVLNSVNVSTELIVGSVKKSRVSSLARVVDLLQEHAHDLGAFISDDSRGKHVPAHLAELSKHLIAGQEAVVGELDSLRQNVEHIKEIVAMQQDYATVGGVKEMINVADVVEDSLRLNVGALSRHHVEVIREFGKVPSMNVEKHKILQILVNLVRNAKYACDESGRADKRLTVRVADSDGRIKITVMDNGVGISPENLTRIFSHGFTTRRGGHGFGLHSGALAAKEMGGSLSVHSDGIGCGATFTLELPGPARELK